VFVQRANFARAIFFFFLVLKARIDPAPARIMANVTPAWWILEARFSLSSGQALFKLLVSYPPKLSSTCSFRNYTMQLSQILLGKKNELNSLYDSGNFPQ